MELKDLRNEIDGIDAQLIELFERRMKVCAQVAAYKMENNLPVLDAGRESEKLARLETLMSEDMKEYGAALYTKLFALSREYQTKIMEQSQN